MQYQGIIKEVKIKANDTDKYVRLIIELDSNSNTDYLTNLMLKYCSLTIKEINY